MEREGTEGEEDEGRGEEGKGEEEREQEEGGGEKAERREEKRERTRTRKKKWGMREEEEEAVSLPFLAVVVSHKGPNTSPLVPPAVPGSWAEDHVYHPSHHVPVVQYSQMSTTTPAPHLPSP